MCIVGMGGGQAVLKGGENMEYYNVDITIEELDAIEKSIDMSQINKEVSKELYQCDPN